MPAYEEKVLQSLKELRMSLVSSLNTLLEQNQVQTEHLKNLGGAMVASGEKRAKDGGFSNIMFGNLNHFFKNISEMATGMGDLRKGLKGFSKVDKEGQIFTNFIKNMACAITMDGKFDDPNRINKMYTEFGIAFEKIAKNTGTLARGMMWLTAAEKMGGSKVYKKVLDTVFDKALLDDMDPEKAKQSSVAMRHMAGTMTIYALTSMVVAPIVVATAPLMAVGLLAMKGLAMMMSWVASSVSDKVEPAADAIRTMSMSLLLFAGSLALSSAIILMAAPAIAAGLPVLLLGIGAMGLAFGLLGKFEESITKGASAVILMSVSMIAFGLGLALTSAVLGSEALKTSAILAGSLVMLGIVYALAGAVSFSIIMGAVAFTAMGVSLISIGLGIATVNALLGNNKEQEAVNRLPGILFNLSWSYALAGLMSPFIILGSIAYTLMGVSLMALSGGIWAVNKVAPDEDRMNQVKGAISGTLTAFIQPFKSIGLKGVLMIPAAIGSVIMMGLALVSLATGLKKFAKLAEQFDLPHVANKINVIVGMVGAAFGDFAAEGKNALRFRDPVTGEMRQVHYRSALRGVRFTKKIGKSLESFGEGLKLWADSFTFKGAGPDSIVSIADKVATVVGITSAMFGDMATDSRRKLRFRDPITGEYRVVKNRSVLRGVKFVRKSGDALQSIGDGLRSWADLSEKDLDLPAIAENIASVVTIISKAFADVADQKEQKTALFGLVKYNKNKVKEGIQSVRGVGDEMKGIATGLKIFADLEKRGIDFNDISKNVSTVVTIISKAFADVADQKEQNTVLGVLKISRNKVKEGIKAVKGVSAEFRGIAEGIKAFGDIKKEGIDIETIGSHIEMVITVVSSAFAGMADTGNVEDGIKNARGVSKELNGIANELMLFNKIGNVKQLGSNVASAINSIMGTVTSGENEFTKMDYQRGLLVKGILERMAKPGISKNAKELSSNMVNMIDKINEVSDMKMRAMGKFIDKFVELEDASTRRLKKNVEEAVELIEAIDKAEDKPSLAKIAESLVKMTDEQTPEAEAQNKTNELLQQMMQQQQSLLSALNNMSTALKGRLDVKIGG